MASSRAAARGPACRNTPGENAAAPAASPRGILSSPGNLLRSSGSPVEGNPGSSYRQALLGRPQTARRKDDPGLPSTGDPEDRRRFPGDDKIPRGLAAGAAAFSPGVSRHAGPLAAARED